LEHWNDEMFVYESIIYFFILWREWEVYATCATQALRWRPAAELTGALRERARAEMKKKRALEENVVVS
jgi:hypothetical protein